MNATSTLPQEDDQPSEIPRACRRLFKALANSLLLCATVKSAVVEDMVQTSPASAMLLRDHLKIDPDNPIRVGGTIYDAGFRPLMLESLISMIGRTEGNRLLHEMENDDPAR